MEKGRQTEMLIQTMTRIHICTQCWCNAHTCVYVKKQLFWWEMCRKYNKIVSKWPWIQLLMPMYRYHAYLLLRIAHATHQKTQKATQKNVVHILYNKVLTIMLSSHIYVEPTANKSDTTIKARSGFTQSWYTCFGDHKWYLLWTSRIYPSMDTFL